MPWNVGVQTYTGRMSRSWGCTREPKGDHGGGELVKKELEEAAAWVGGPTLGWRPYLGLAHMFLMGNQRGNNIVQITEAKGSTLPRPHQRQAVGCSNPIKTKLSKSHVENWVHRPQGLSVRVLGDLWFPSGFLCSSFAMGDTTATRVCSLSWLQGFIVFSSIFFTSYL